MVEYKEERVYKGITLETMKACVQAASDLTRESYGNYGEPQNWRAPKPPKLRGSTLKFSVSLRNDDFHVSLNISPIPGGSKISVMGEDGGGALTELKKVMASFFANLDSLPEIREFMEKKAPPGEKTMAYVPLTCSSCGHPNLPGSKYCSKCGRKLG